MKFVHQNRFYRDGPTASVSVLPGIDPEGKETGLSVQVNGKSDGNTEVDFYTMQLLGHIPVLLADRAEKVCVIGFGTGMTAGVFRQY